MVSTEKNQHTQWITAGDSLASGGPPTVHFGLGHLDEESVEVEIILPDGRRVQDTLNINAHSTVRIDG